MIRRKLIHLLSAISLFVTCVCTTAFAGSPMINVGAATAGGGEGLAVAGFDPVAYFTDSMPVEGTAEFSLEHDGATWQFASMENLEMFKSDPMRYAPQYGGYCAYAVTKGKAKSIDPTAWKIIDDKLYLNHTMAVQEKWLPVAEQGIQDADAMWPDMLK